MSLIRGASELYKLFIQWFLVFNGRNHFAAGAKNFRFLELEPESEI